MEAAGAATHDEQECDDDAVVSQVRVVWPVWPEVPWVVGSGQTTINTAVHQQPVKLVIPSLDGPARQAVVKAVRGSARTTILPRRAHRARALIFELPPLAQKLYAVGVRA